MIDVLLTEDNVLMGSKNFWVKHVEQGVEEGLWRIIRTSPALSWAVIGRNISLWSSSKQDEIRQKFDQVVDHNQFKGTLTERVFDLVWRSPRDYARALSLSLSLTRKSADRTKFSYFFANLIEEEFKLDQFKLI